MIKFKLFGVKKTELEQENKSLKADKEALIKDVVDLNNQNKELNNKITLLDEKIKFLSEQNNNLIKELKVYSDKSISSTGYKNY